MKKINNILLTFVALLAFAPIAGAQSTINEICKDKETGEAPEFPEDNGTYSNESDQVGYKKVISKPQKDGTYWIKLEAFAKGTGEVTSSSQPSDCVLVLDLSSSMSSNYTTRRPKLAEAEYTYNSYNYSNNNRLYYKHTDGNYYQVSRGAGNNNPRYYLRYQVGNTYWYLSGDSSTTDNTRFNSADDVIFTGVLYGATTENVSRLQALKEACIEFVESLATNAAQSSAVNSSFPGNRIAIVTYAGEETSERPSYIELASDWQDVTANKTAIEAAINGFNLDNHSGTRPELGLQMVIDELTDDIRDEASFNVLLFTDGYPVQSIGSGNNQVYLGGDNAYGTGQTRFTCSFANEAIHAAHILKETYDATVFSVGLITSVTAGNTTAYQNYRRVLYLMDLISSDYPNSDFTGTDSDVAWDIDGSYNITVTTGLVTGADSTPNGKYFQLVNEDTDLSTIFKQISEMAATAPSNMSSASTTVDVVSSSFLLPENATADDIKLFTAKCTGDNPWSFEREYFKGTSPWYAYNDDGITYSTTKKVDEDFYAEITGNKIEVKNFDYSKNWCGPVTAGSTVTYHGYKVIIMIPIRMNPDAVGGPNVDTNGEGSGLFDNNGNSVVAFKSPAVSLPVNVYIEKAGLEARESAKFKIERALIPTTTGWTPEGITDWEYVSTVFVTNSPNSSFTNLDDTGKLTADSNPMVRVKGMPATQVLWWENEDDPTDTAEEKDDTHTKPHQQGLIYKITEEPWSWSYTPMTDPQYTVTEKVDNPFTFTNEKRTDDNIDVTVRHAESKVMNVFKKGTGQAEVGTDILYDDSKKNVGREDYYLPPTKPTTTVGEGGEGGEGGNNGGE